ncbi:MAG: hypothetical protein J6O41_08290 [Clostridia bacterium]|nr:hypothetical protein [Clostridia bacterium]
MKENKKTAIVCGTPYQLFNALDIICSDKSETKYDIFCFDRFQNSDLYQKRSKKIKRINRFFLLNDYQKDYVNGKQLKGVLKYIHSAFLYLRPRNSIKKYFDNINDWKYTVSEKYDRIMAPTPSFLLQCLEKNNSKAILDYYEDGLGSYMGDFNADSASLSRKVFSRIFKVGYNVIPVRNLYVYSPDLCYSTVSKRINKLPAVTPAFLDIADYVFGFYPQAIDKNDIIWLGQRRFDDTVVKILEVLSKSNLNVLVRKHPKENNIDRYHELGLEIDDGKNMWEMLLLKHDIADNILVSSYSTAVFTPKLLFDKEPYILLVYNLFDDIDTLHLKKTKQFVKLFRGIYEHKERIIIPKSFEEFERIIKKLCNKKTGH